MPPCTLLNRRKYFSNIKCLLLLTSFAYSPLNKWVAGCVVKIFQDGNCKTIYYTHNSQLFRKNSCFFYIMSLTEKSCLTVALKLDHTHTCILLGILNNCTCRIVDVCFALTLLVPIYLHVWSAEIFFIQSSMFQSELYEI